MPHSVCDKAKGKGDFSHSTSLSAVPTIAPMPTAIDPLTELDMIGRELYARRVRELTLFGAMTEPEAHDWALRYALGKSSLPPVQEYPDDYSLPAQ